MYRLSCLIQLVRVKPFKSNCQRSDREERMVLGVREIGSKAKVTLRLQAREKARKSQHKDKEQS